MSDERPLYTSLEQDIAAPGFARFCRGFRGAAIQELCIRPDGTGVYLKASGRSIDLIYRPNSFNMALVGRTNTPEGRLNWVPEGKETLIKDYIPTDIIGQVKIAIEPGHVIKGLVSALYEGEEVEEAVLETRLGRVLNMSGFRTPEDTPFFLTSPLPIRFKDDEIMFFMEPGTFLHAVCETGGERAVYVPEQSDR